MYFETILSWLVDTHVITTYHMLSMVLYETGANKMETGDEWWDDSGPIIFDIIVTQTCTLMLALKL